MKRTIKNHQKILEKSLKNHQKIDQNRGLEVVWAALGEMVPLPSLFFLFLEASWGVLGACGGVLGALGGVLGASWGVLGHLGGVLGASCGILAASRERLQGKPRFLIDFCFQLRPLKLIKSSPRCRESSIFKKSLLGVNIVFYPMLVPTWLPKSSKIDEKPMPRCLPMLDLFFDRF